MHTTTSTMLAFVGVTTSCPYDMPSASDGACATGRPYADESTAGSGTCHMRILSRMPFRYAAMAGRELQHLAATRSLAAFALITLATLCLYPITSPLAHIRLQTQGTNTIFSGNGEPQPPVDRENTTTAQPENASVAPPKTQPPIASAADPFSVPAGAVLMPVNSQIITAKRPERNDPSTSPFIRQTGAWQVIMPISAKKLPDTGHAVQRADAAAPRQMPYGGLLALMPDGTPAMRAATGYTAVRTLREVHLKNPETPRAFESITAVASGAQRVEELLRQFDENLHLLQPVSERFSLTEYMSNGYDHSTIFHALPRFGSALRVFAQCRLDRLEMADWLTEARENALASGSYLPQSGLQYRDYVERFSRYYALPPSLIYAIMRTESSFNPKAISSANALGLMQVVPQTAGGEVYAYLNGQSGTPRAETLFSPESNIRYGATYLHLLNEKHFKNVRNYVSRELCIIAAYNGGPGAVLRVFDRNDREKAVDAINKLSPDQVYATLRSSLPSQETRDYIVKVTAARNQYRQIFDF